MNIRSYSKIYNVGHAQVGRLTGLVTVEEKVDGSQFSFSVQDGNLQCRSKKQEIHIGDEVNGLFEKAVATAVSLWEMGLLNEGWTYRCEAVSRPKHNVLCYERAPAAGLVLYDVDRGEEDYLTYTEKDYVSLDLGLELVPCFYEGPMEDITEEMLTSWVQGISFLGGTAEGVVIKAYGQYGRDKKTLMAKFVGPKMRECQGKDWRARNPTKGDIMRLLTDQFRSEARWDKAIIHLEEQGRLEHEPSDIGPLMKELASDFVEECEEEVKERFWDWARKNLIRGVTAGFPEYYKKRLLKRQFELGDEDAEGDNLGDPERVGHGAELAETASAPLGQDA